MVSWNLLDLRFRFVVSATNKAFFLLILLFLESILMMVESGQG